MSAASEDKAKADKQNNIQVERNNICTSDRKTSEEHNHQQQHHDRKNRMLLILYLYGSLLTFDACKPRVVAVLS